MLAPLGNEHGGVMPSATSTTAKPGTASDTRKVVGWKSPLFPFSTRSSDGRMLDRPANGVRVRGLPVGMKWQRVATAGHDQATTGLATLTKTWETDGEFWGSGPIDTEDPDGALLARKIRDGYVNLVSVDLADWTAAVKDVGGHAVEVLTDYELISATFLNDAAYGQARVFPVYEDERDEIVPNSTVLAQRRKEAGLLGVGNTLTFDSGTVITLTPPVEGFTVTGDTSLPWAPRAHEWDAAAASNRVWEWADGDTAKLAKAHLYRDPDADPTTKSAYSLPFADVINGRLTAVFRGVSNAAGRLNQTDIPEPERERVAARIRELYAAANKALGPSREGPESGPPITIPPKVKNMSDDEVTPVETGDVVEMADESTKQLAAALAPRLAAELVPVLADAVAVRLSQLSAEGAADEQAEAVEMAKGEVPPQFLDDDDDADDDDDDCNDPDLSAEEKAACRERKAKARADRAESKMRVAAACARMGV